LHDWLVFLPLLLLSALIISKLPLTQRVGFMALGVGFTLFMPIIYAVMGFLVGVTSGWLYNLFAQWIGGIEVEID
jgi:hypothetical protein